VDARPAAYSPRDYANDLSPGSSRTWRRDAEKPVVVGHSMGGLNVLAFARNCIRSARAARWRSTSLSRRAAGGIDICGD
jgi:pimeloyl-ACP methyl ester carboxylesterase